MSEIENLEAERNAIGAAILAAPKKGAVHPAHSTLLSLESSDFTDHRHRVIAAVVRDMITKGLPIDQATVCGELEARAKLSTPGGAGGSVFVFDLCAPHVQPASAEYYAEQVRRATRVRMLHDMTRELAAMCQQEDAGAHMDDLLRMHRTALDAIPGPISRDDSDELDQVGVIMSEQDKPTDWVIPGWLAREDRAVLVAGEGIAKTTMLRQFAVAVAGGLNPWTGQRVADGQRVLFIDAENSRNQSRRAYQWIAGRVVRPTIATGWKERLIHKTRNDGVDLPGRDAKWFMDVAARVSPDVLILGPAYKLMRGDPQKDRDVQDLLDVIDKVRVQQGCAVLVETHAPHGSRESRHMRPYGSSVWLRWPEIGIGYQRDTSEGVVQFPRPQTLESVDWRGQREDRDWPDFIEYGDPRHREMPWKPVRPDWEPSVDLGYQIPDTEGRAA
jgi:replicative DNA helicase